MTRKILLTGASGFVGRQVLNYLATQDVQLYVVARPKAAEKFRSDTRVFCTIPTADIFSESPSWWAGVLQNIDVVIHMAWQVSEDDYLNSSANFECLAGTVRLAVGAVDAKVKKFVGVGSCSEYALSNQPLPPLFSLKPNSLYAESKVAAFNLLDRYFSSHDVEFAWPRLFYLFGEGQGSNRLIPHLNVKLAAGEPVKLSSGDQILDYMDVKKAGELIARVGLGPEKGPLNICSGCGVTVRELAESVADIYKRRDLLVFDDARESKSNHKYVVGIPSDIR